MSTKRKLTTLTYADKLKAIEAVKNGLKRKEVAAQFGIHESTLSLIIKKEAEILKKQESGGNLQFIELLVASSSGLRLMRLKRVYVLKNTVSSSDSNSVAVTLACSKSTMNRTRWILLVLCKLLVLKILDANNDNELNNFNDVNDDIDDFLNNVSDEDSSDKAILSDNADDNVLKTFDNKLIHPTYTTLRSTCQCWNITKNHNYHDNNHKYYHDNIFMLSTFETECVCFGDKLYKIPKYLNKYVHRLTIIDSNIRVLTKDSLQFYKHTLQDLILSNLKELHRIEIGTLSDMRALSSIYISYCPHLKHLDGLFEGFKPMHFRSLRIMKCGLQRVPDLSPLFHTGIILQMIDLEGNHIQTIPTNSFQVKAEQIILNFNHISSIGDYAFNVSEIGKLSFKGNKHLIHLPSKTFSGIVNIRELDLSLTDVISIPVDGLNTLETLRVEHTPSLKVIPSIYDFKHLKEAWLTYSFHCCAFKYPARHDPTKHKNYQLYLDHIREHCKGYAINKRDLYENENQIQLPQDTADNILPINEFWGDIISNNSTESYPDPNGLEAADEPDSFESNVDGQFGMFHESMTPFKNNTFACGTLSIRFDVKCYPEPDELNPCEDIMGSQWLRISVWFVIITAIIGNLAVLIVLFSNCYDLTVQKFLMCHLATADLFMGLYLLMIASMDLKSIGVYFNYAYDWQIGLGCQVAGFLTVLASQLSVFTLSVVTLERWFAITHAIYLNRRINLTMAAHIMAAGWAYSILMAALPLFGVSNYSSTSICLPMETEELTDTIYLLTLLITTGVAFLLVVICYAQIYFSLDTGTRKSGRCGTTAGAMEMTVARKMALLVFTDFACWAPIAFFSFTALIGIPLIDVTKSKILLVFFYPLNSCANPYLYALLTAQYKRDLYSLLSRFGICTKKAHRYKLTYSLQTTNNSNPIPLTVRGSLAISTNDLPRKYSKPSTTEIFV
ncbi:lutropin-choriogonadotropic hormone receptor-like [Chrysoperla carnea]|uniref:lutropin-choriogonadotropic hormone receptor-like n=1 Tax=Chrysoperla carnea TaxID=189513 RepID=UPI001D09753E|nr:lutropin-choriogonadotropic hormone receptor-like [Chrysoperla carnea]